MPLTSARPFQLHVPDAALADLRERLARTRFPDQAPGEPWAHGTQVEYLQELVAYWRDRFDWRAQEARLNALPQFKVPLHGIELHYLCVPGKGPDPCPLLLSHGWPGSVFEFHKIMPLLTEHFTVIAPSLPGYTLSFKPGQQRFVDADALPFHIGKHTHERHLDLPEELAQVSLFQSRFEQHLKVKRENHVLA